MYKTSYNSENYKFERSLDFDENRYIGVFEVTKQDFAIGLSKFKMADPIWRLKIRKSFCLELVYRGLLSFCLELV